MALRTQISCTGRRRLRALAHPRCRLSLSVFEKTSTWAGCKDLHCLWTSGDPSLHFPRTCTLLCSCAGRDSSICLFAPCMRFVLHEYIGFGSPRRAHFQSMRGRYSSNPDGVSPARAPPYAFSITQCKRVTQATQMVSVLLARRQ